MPATVPTPSLASYCGFGNSYFKKLKFFGSFIVFNKFYFFGYSIGSGSVISRIGFTESELVLIIELPNNS